MSEIEKEMKISTLLGRLHAARQYAERALEDVRQLEKLIGTSYELENIKGELDLIKWLYENYSEEGV